MACCVVNTKFIMKKFISKNFIKMKLKKYQEIDKKSIKSFICFFFLIILDLKFFFELKHIYPNLKNDLSKCFIIILKSLNFAKVETN